MTVFRILPVLVLAVVVPVLVHLWWVPLALWFVPAAGGAQAGEAALDLSDYAVTIEGRRVEGLARNISGLTWNAETGTLFATVNRPATVAELSPDGRLLRRLPLPAGWDAEGITHVEGDLFIIADEAGNLLHWVTIPAAGGVILGQTQRLRLGWRALPNLGFEGISWDEARAELLLVNEKWPRKVLQISGLGPGPAVAPVTMREWWPVGWPSLPAGDLASLTTHEASGNLLLLSEQSRLILEYGRDGRLLGALPLQAGVAGLTRDVPQPEGLAIGSDGSLFIVSEPDLFYRFAASPG